MWSQLTDSHYQALLATLLSMGPSPSPWLYISCFEQKSTDIIWKRVDKFWDRFSELVYHLITWDILIPSHLQLSMAHQEWLACWPVLWSNYWIYWARAWYLLEATLLYQLQQFKQTRVSVLPLAHLWFFHIPFMLSENQPASVDIGSQVWSITMGTLAVWER